MSNRNIIRAWKDPGYRKQLTAAERAVLPANPAGAVEISEGDLGTVAGGRPIGTWWCSYTMCTCHFDCIPTYLC